MESHGKRKFRLNNLTFEQKLDNNIKNRWYMNYIIVHQEIICA